MDINHPARHLSMKRSSRFYSLLGPLSPVDQYRSTVAFVVVTAAILLLDLLAARLYPSFLEWSALPGFVQGLQQSGIELISYAEVWAAVLALVLGTLIIVISIASQSTPKLIDLYLRDWTSLFYVWFLTIAAAHNIYLQFVVGSHIASRQSSILLSTCILLPIAALLSVPYIYYILRYSKTSTVIEKIQGENLRRIAWLQYPSARRRMATERGVGEIQFALFESLNQLDDLLEYVSFKEPKGDIIRKIGTSLQEYVAIKQHLPLTFFKVSERVREDISFKTLIGQFEDLEQTQTIYEQKGFRLLSNAYMRLLESWDFDLSALCVFEITEVGRTAVQHNDDRLIDLILVRLNTILRIGIKHGVRNSEARNLYNALFHYSQFIHVLVDSGNVDKANRACEYLKIYGSEIYRIGRENKSLAFLVDVIISEIKGILIHISEENWPLEQQARILGLMLQMDNMPGSERSDVESKKMIYDHVRKLQIALALHYIRTGSETLSEMIIGDILDDFDVLGERLFRNSVDSACQFLRIATPKFWEDTDRGDGNIYYTPDKEYIEEFRRVLEARITEHKATGKRIGEGEKSVGLIG
jgi:hypothetical protein